MKEVERICANCAHRSKSGFEMPCRECIGEKERLPNWIYIWGEKNAKKEISFPILNNLTPTVESCTMKLIEELGELLRLIGKGQGQSGESELTVEQLAEEIETNMVREAFDVAQSAVTMIDTLCKKHGLDIDMFVLDHKMKLYEKEYLK